KSTLVLCISEKLKKSEKILYISGEESSSQIKMRAERMKFSLDNLFISSEIVAENIDDMVRSEKPSLVFIDSIQTISRINNQGQAGTVSQLRDCTQVFLELSKSTGIPIILIGHITKEGSIAGPKVLEHLVDLVIYFESDKLNHYRILRAVKNRFGPVGDIAIFEMTSSGLKEILNKNNLFISGKLENRTGSALSAVMEGSRALTVEVQALVSRTSYSQARRMSEGIDNRRLILLSAVLEKYLFITLSACDIFSNLAGGLNVDEPSLDLAICASILSSYMEQEIISSTAFLGEVGLSGEVRPISYIIPRLKELVGLGIKKVFLPSGNKKDIPDDWKMAEIIYLNHISELKTLIFNMDRKKLDEISK
ncbi:MAG: DNA repair protein RadA, partial [Leptospiraceae bacterium]|nr:DNA repair protein RadA [Leptospiraceae bacterium]